MTLFKKKTYMQLRISALTLGNNYLFNLNSSQSHRRIVLISVYALTNTFRANKSKRVRLVRIRIH